jgi:hypothetical protein
MSTWWFSSAFFRAVWSPWKNLSVMPEFFTLAVPL